MSIDVQHRYENTYFVTFNNKNQIVTTVTSSGDEVDTWIQGLNSDRWNLPLIVIGLDVEWRPNTGSMQNPVAVIQLCMGYLCLIFQIIHADYVPDSLKNFLTDERFTFVGLGIRADVAKINDFYDLKVCNVKDLGELAEEKGRPELRRVGLSTLAMEVTGDELNKPKEVTMSRWDHRTLSFDQVGYACVDAYLSFKIGRTLLTGRCLC